MMVALLGTSTEIFSGTNLVEKGFNYFRVAIQAGYPAFFGDISLILFYASPPVTFAKVIGMLKEGMVLKVI